MDRGQSLRTRCRSLCCLSAARPPPPDCTTTSLELLCCTTELQAHVNDHFVKDDDEVQIVEEARIVAGGCSGSAAATAASPAVPCPQCGAVLPPGELDSHLLAHQLEQEDLRQLEAHGRSRGTGGAQDASARAAAEAADAEAAAALAAAEWGGGGEGSDGDSEAHQAQLEELYFQELRARHGWAAAPRQGECRLCGGPGHWWVRPAVVVTKGGWAGCPAGQARSDGALQHKSSPSTGPAAASRQCLGPAHMPRCSPTLSLARARECPDNPEVQAAAARVLDPPTPAAIVASQQRVHPTTLAGGLVQLLAGCLEAAPRGSSPGTYAAALCGPVQHFGATLFSAGWGCGYNNMQMLAAHLLAAQPVSFCRNAVCRLQRWLWFKVAGQLGIDSWAASRPISCQASCRLRPCWLASPACPIFPPPFPGLLAGGARGAVWWGWLGARHSSAASLARWARQGCWRARRGVGEREAEQQDRRRRCPHVPLARPCCTVPVAHVGGNKLPDLFALPCSVLQRRRGRQGLTGRVRSSWAAECRERM